MKPSFKYAYGVSGEEDKSVMLNELLPHFIFLVQKHLQDPLVGDSQNLD